MADVREAFATLEDASTGAGLPLHKVLEGDAAAAKNASAALVAIDESANLKYLEMNAQNELKVTSQGDEARLTDHGTSVGSATRVVLATLTLTNDAVYKRVGWIVGCYRSAEFEIEQEDDVGGIPTTTTHALILVGAGDYNDSQELEALAFTAGSTGVIELKLFAKNIGTPLSDFRGTLTAVEEQ